jgi:hypothetical protein
MIDKPYNKEEISNFFSVFPMPNIPDLLQLIIQSRAYANMDYEDRADFSKYLENINNHNNTWDPLGDKEETIGFLKDRLKKKDLSKFARNGIISRVKELESNEPLIDLDRLLLTKFTNEELVSTAKYEWGRVKFHFKFIDVWKNIFNAISFREVDLEDLPEGNFEVYRAGIKEGLSWTKDIEVAKWFYNRNVTTFNQKPQHNHFLKLNVTKEEILFYATWRNEDECVLIPNQEKIIPMRHEEIKDIPVKSPRKTANQ